MLSEKVSPRIVFIVSGIAITMTLYSCSSQPVSTTKTSSDPLRATSPLQADPTTSTAGGGTVSLATEPPSSQEEDDSLKKRPGECRSDPHPIFESLFTDLDRIRFLSPLGTISHSIIQHSYVWIGEDESGEAHEVPIYAPTDSWLMYAAYYSQVMVDPDGSQVNVAQYSLTFQVSCEVSYKFAHVDRLVDKLSTLVSAEPAITSRSVPVDPPIFVEAGELIGFTRGTISAHNWDFGVTNTSHVNPFVNQVRYEETWDLGVILHADCPYDYYSDPLRGRLFELLPVSGCGMATQDVEGTISGTWFKEQEVKPEDLGDTLYIGETILPWGILYSVLGESQRVDVPLDQPTAIHPSEIKHTHCYQGSGDPLGYVFVELIDEKTIKVAFGQGECPNRLPEAYEVFYR